jgi:hypothetical protein
MMGKIGCVRMFQLFGKRGQLNDAEDVVWTITRMQFGENKYQKPRRKTR